MKSRLGRLWVCGGAALAVLFGAGSVLAQEQLLTGDEIRSAMVGKKLFARAGTGGLLDLVMRADGTAQIAIGNMTDTGTWKMTDKGYCATWQKRRAGQERCFTVVRRGSSLVIFNPDQSVSAEVLRVSD